MGQSPLPPRSVSARAASRVMWPVTEAVLPGRGMGLVAARDIQAGETVLVDEPLLLFVQPPFAAHACAQCLRMLSAGRLRRVAYMRPALLQASRRRACVVLELPSMQARRAHAPAAQPGLTVPAGSAVRHAKLPPRCLAALTAWSSVLRFAP
jgi:hypothetical protein